MVMNLTKNYPSFLTRFFTLFFLVSCNFIAETDLSSLSDKMGNPPPFPSDAFVTVWETTTASETITLPLTASGSYNFWVDWGDGTSDTISAWNAPEKTHTYAAPGIYTVVITGLINEFRFNNSADAPKILNVLQWGGHTWQAMNGAFWGASNLQISASDAPDLSSLSSLSQMFQQATNFNSPINHWDVSTITDMSSMFREASNFNRPLDNWFTFNVTNMSSMFREAFSFNQDIRWWQTDNVTDMSFMLNGASSFNQDIGLWETGNVTNMNSMFQNAANFNQDIGLWDTGNVTNMNSMFQNAASFNQDLSSWCVELITAAPASFALDASSWTSSPQPNWGALCP